MKRLQVKVGEERNHVLRPRKQIVRKKCRWKSRAKSREECKPEKNTGQVPPISSAKIKARAQKAPMPEYKC